MTTAEINQKKNGCAGSSKNTAHPATNTQVETRMDVFVSMPQSGGIANANAAPLIERHEPGPDWATVVPPFTALLDVPQDFTRIVEREIGQVAGVRVSISQFQTIDEGVRSDGDPLITVDAGSRLLDFSQGHALISILFKAQKLLGEITGKITTDAVTR